MKTCAAAALAIAMVTLVAADSHDAPQAEATPPVTHAVIDGAAPGFVTLGPDDFTPANTPAEMWQWREDGSLHCTGSPIGGLRSKKIYTNFEMVFEWKHHNYAGNSGVFVWGPKDRIDNLPPNKLPVGIEVQILDLGYGEQWEKRHNKPSDWFTCHGDVFPVGGSKMKPFPPAAPNGQRSFPTHETTRPFGQWNHYYLRCINGEVRLWVNGVEVSGGNACEPRTGYVVFEAEGAPIDFRNIRLRELP